MSFDMQKFQGAAFSDRTEEVPVPELAKFFKEGAKPVWTVRQLSAEELAIVNLAVDQNKNTANIMTALTSNMSKVKVEGIKQAMGMSDETAPDDVVRRIAMLTAGSVSPACPQDLAVKLGNHFASTFFHLTNRIISLTGEGALGE